jgi:hypothetical protein
MSEKKESANSNNDDSSDVDGAEAVENFGENISGL